MKLTRILKPKATSAADERDRRLHERGSSNGRLVLYGPGSSFA